MNKKIVVWSAKGGVGKTFISYNLYLEWGLGVITNEYYSELKDVVDKDFLKCLSPREEFPKIKKDWNIVVDMAGTVTDKRVITAVEQCDCVIIPLTYSNDGDMFRAMNSYKEISKYSKKMIFVGNIIRKPKQSKNIKNTLLEYNLDHIPYFEIRASEEGPQRIRTHKKSFQQLVREGGVLGNYSKNIAKDFDILMNFINKKYYV